MTLRKAVHTAAQAEGSIRLTGDVFLKLDRNARDLRLLIGVNQAEVVLPTGFPVDIVPVDRVALPDHWISRLDALADKEPNASTQKVVRSKVRYAILILPH